MKPLHWVLYGVAVLLAVCVYFFDLDGQHIPKNGDEYPYAHIARMTAASGHLLPLQSELNGMRNTKPPLLFWQGIVSTHWGQEWTLWHLRYPSVIYTLLTSLLVFLLAWKLSRDPAKGFIGCLSFLAFFSTYRFGRPFLTNPPEVFWLFAPFFTLLYWRPAAFDSRAVPLLIGALVGIGLLYKSFALLLPIGLTLAWWYFHQRDYKLRDFIRDDVWKLILLAVIALTIFALWFALDPQPQAIWQEFIVKENAGKFDAQDTSYWRKFLWGSSSVWVLVLAYPLNAGLLAFPVIALIIDVWRRYAHAQLSDAEKLLWIFLLVMLLVFSLPSQRSSRYVLAAMPALAVLCALAWERIGRAWFIATLICVVLLVMGLGYLALQMQSAVSIVLYTSGFWLLLTGALGFALLAMCLPKLTKPGASVAVVLSFFSLALFLRPFDGALGQYDASVQRQMQGVEVWVPYDFNAKDELYRFLLPAAQIHGYREERQPEPRELARQYPRFAVRVPLNADLTLLCPGCRLIGERLDLRGRHTPEEQQEILHGKVFENLFVKEVLLAAPMAGSS